MSIALIVPSRGRPGAIAELADAVLRTTDQAAHHVGLVVAVDDDDPNLALYHEAVPAWAELIVGTRMRLGPTLNKVAVERVKMGIWDAIAFCGDDHRPRTVGWNRLIGEVLASAPGVAYGNDLVHGEGLPTAAFISAGIVERLGYFVPSGIIHLFADDAWKAIGQATALHYLPDVVIEHLHPIAGKAEWDDSYRENNSEATWAHDQAAFTTWLASDWQTALR